MRQEAGNAVAWGLPAEKALAAITSAPAAIYGVSDRVGRVAPGLLADLVIWSGDPLELSTQPERVFVGGIEQPLRSRQTDLLERYRTLPPAR
jgi:imidazolonepropionase-like amidohydrolase